MTRLVAVDSKYYILHTLMLCNFPLKGLDMPTFLEHLGNFGQIWLNPLWLPSSASLYRSNFNNYWVISALYLTIL